MYLGIDLTASEAKRSACAALIENGTLYDLHLLGDDNSILAWIAATRSKVVAIDAPLSLPSGLCCLEEACPCQPLAADGLKAAERELLRHGISLYLTGKRSIIKRMAYRGIKLREALERRGMTVLEVYPFASKVILFGRPIPKKVHLAGRAWLQERLIALVPGLGKRSTVLSHDELDAVVAAYTAYLYGRSYADGVGDPEEGLIYLPDPNALLDNGPSVALGLAQTE